MVIVRWLPMVRFDKYAYPAWAMMTKSFTFIQNTKLIWYTWTVYQFLFLGFYHP